MNPHPPLAVTTRLTARALGWSAPELQQALQPARRADLPEVVDLRRRHLGGLIDWDDAAYLAWRYRLDGDASPGFGSLWTLRRGAELLALVGCEDMVCVARGRRLAGQRLMDVLIQPALADSGLGAWLNQSMFERAAFTLAVGANRNSKGMVTRLFKPLSPMRSLVHPLRLGPLLGRSAAPRPARRVMAWAGDAGLAAWHRLLALQRAAGLELKPVTRFDAAEVLPPCALGAAGGVQIERTGAYLQQRLLAHPRLKVDVEGAYRGERRVGYLAWHLRERDDQRHELRLLDWHVSDDDPGRCWGLLLRAAVAAARRRGCVAVRLESQASDALPQRRRHGFVQRPGSAVVQVGLQCSAEMNGLGELPWALNPLCDDSDDH